MGEVLDSLATHSEMLFLSSLGVPQAIDQELSTGFAPAAGPATICWLAGLLICWLDLELILEVFRVSGVGFW